MIHSNVLHEEATAYRFSNGRYVVTQPFWPEGRSPEDELFRLGFSRSQTYHGGTYAVWQKERMFVFIIRVGTTSWTVEVIGLPNYVQFVSENLGPVMDYSDRLPDGATTKKTSVSDAPAAAGTPPARTATTGNTAAGTATANSTAASDAAPATSPTDAPPRDGPSCIAAIGVIDNGWRQCFNSFARPENLQVNATPRPVRPPFLCNPARPVARRTQLHNDSAMEDPGSQLPLSAGRPLDRRTG